MAVLTSGAILGIYRSEVTSGADGPLLQVIDIRPIKSGTGTSQQRYRLILSDGDAYQQAMLATQKNDLVTDGKLKQNAIVRLSEFICTGVQNRRIVIVLDLDIVEADHKDKIGAPQNIDTVVEDIATSLENRAGLYEAQGQYGDAEPMYVEALAMWRQLHGADKDHPDIASGLNNLAGLYKAQGRYGEAEPLMMEALAMLERVVGASHEPPLHAALGREKDHPNIAASLNNLGELYRAQGRYDGAESMYVEALAMDRRLHGAEKDHPMIAGSLNNLAALYESQERHGEVEPLMVEALAMERRMHGAAKDHPGIATSLNNLAKVYEAQGRYGEAEPLMVEALEMTRRMHGAAKDHPDIALSLNNLSKVYHSQGRYGEATPLMVEAMATLKRVHGAETDHPAIATSLNNLATLYEAQGRHAEAEPMYMEALAMYRRVHGAEKDHPDIARSLNNLAQMYEEQGRHGEVEPLRVEALAIFKRVHGAKKDTSTAGDLAQPTAAAAAGPRRPRSTYWSRRDDDVHLNWVERVACTGEKWTHSGELPPATPHAHTHTTLVAPILSPLSHLLSAHRTPHVHPTFLQYPAPNLPAGSQTCHTRPHLECAVLHRRRGGGTIGAGTDSVCHPAPTTAHSGGVPRPRRWRGGGGWRARHRCGNQAVAVGGVCG